MQSKHSLSKSFGYAFSGLFYFFKTERNGSIHLIAVITVITSGFSFDISAMEWIAVLLCIAAVLSLEMVNSAIEKLCDEFHPQYHPQIKVIKDITAAAVLWASIISVAIACIIFFPKLDILI